MTTINVRDYGATGDGVTFDHAAIYDACAAAEPGDVVFFPDLLDPVALAAGQLDRVVLAVGQRVEGAHLESFARDVADHAEVFARGGDQLGGADQQREARRRALLELGLALVPLRIARSVALVVVRRRCFAHSSASPEFRRRLAQDPCVLAFAV